MTTSPLEEKKPTIGAMRAIVTRHDAPGRVQIAHVPRPVAASTDALVRVSATSVNPIDLDLVTHAPDGRIAGHEVAGIVEVPAADGSGPAAGSRMAGMTMGGGWAEYAAIPTSQITSLPDTVDVTRAAALPVAGLSALRALRALGPTIGRRVLVTGATGSVGRLAVQLAAISGASTVAAIARDTDAHALLSRLGASATSGIVNEDLGIFDGVIESVGGATLTRAFPLLASNGTLVSVGRASADDVVLTPDDLRADRSGSGRTIRTFFMPEEGADLGPDLDFLLRLVATDRLRLDIDDGVPIDRGLELLRERSWVGKLVLLTRG